jgi:NADPH:quinone reductase-like Zn-dependent oxidoreductase
MKWRSEGMTRMRAAVLRAYGAPPQIGSLPVPRPGPGQVLVRVTAAPVNPLDLLCASGTSYFGPPALPYVPGTQGVGVIEEQAEDAGPDMAFGQRAVPGQRVWFSCEAGISPGDGALAQWCVCDARAALPLPDDVGDDLVAALGLSAIAAWTALADRGGLRPGEHVLVLGASGTVGQVAVQAARLLGSGRVIAACRDSQGRERARQLGADEVADIGGTDAGTLAESLAKAVAATGGRLDLVLDPVWGKPAEAAMQVLSPGGRLVNLGSSAGQEARIGSGLLRSRMLSVLGYTNASLTGEQRAAALNEILAHAMAGKITADYEVMPLDAVGQAWSQCGLPPYRRAVLVP